MSRQPRLLSYRLHKQSGLAIVTLPDGMGGRNDVLLGPYDTEASRAEYLRVIAEWQVSGRRLPVRAADSGISVNEPILAYWHFAEGYYVKNGEQTSQLYRIRQAMRPLKELYGHTAAKDFGPKALKAVRERMLPCGHCKGKGTLPVPKRFNRRSGQAEAACDKCQGPASADGRAASLTPGRRTGPRRTRTAHAAPHSG